MSNPAKIMLVLIGGVIGLAVGCVLDFTPPPIQCWCGEQWRSQISGATAYDLGDSPSPIDASDTSHTRCVTMLEHVALETADPQDPVYLALRDAFESEAVTNCELAGEAAFPNIFSHTDCAMAGTEPVNNNLVHLGPCWEPGDLEAEPICPVTCDRFQDCSEGPIYLWKGQVQDEGETEGWVPWTGEEALWDCDE
jgi:hypothetical protein